MSGAFHFDAPATRVVFGSGGRLAVGGMRRGLGEIAVFDARGATLLRASEHSWPDGASGPEVVAVVLSPAGDRVASGSSDRRVVVREIGSGRAVAELKNPDPILDLVWHENTLVVFGQTHVVIWDQNSGAKFRERAILDRADARVVGHHGGVVFVCQGGATLACFDVAIGMVVRAARVGAGVAAMAPDGAYALAAEKSGKVAKVIAIHSDFGAKPVRSKVEAPPAALAFAPTETAGHLIAALTNGAVISINRTGLITEHARVSDGIAIGSCITVGDDGRVALAAGDAGLFLFDATKAPRDGV